MIVNKFKKSARNPALVFHLNCVSVADFLTAVCLIAGNGMISPALINTSVLSNKQTCSSLRFNRHHSWLRPVCEVRTGFVSLFIQHILHIKAIQVIYIVHSKLNKKYKMQQRTKLTCFAIVLTLLIIWENPRRQTQVAPQKTLLWQLLPRVNPVSKELH